MWSQGYKGDSIQHVDTDVICFACGNAVKFINDADNSEMVFHSPGNGVQLISASAALSIFAVVENGVNPRIFVCRYPDFEIISVLEGGAQLQYSQIKFSYSGNYLAACSDLPDFNLFLWDWKTGKLRCKEKLLFEETVTSLLFSPVNHRLLSVIGHNFATIWTIEECNTLATLKAKKVPLPASDGTVLAEEEEEAVSRSGTRMGFYIALPSSTKAGLTGEDVGKFRAPEHRHPRVAPSSQYYSSNGELLVGCAAGQLFRVNCDTGKVQVLLGSSSDSLLAGNVVPGMFNCLVLNAAGLVAGGVDGVLRSVQIENNGIKIAEVCQGDSPVTTISFSPSVFVELVYGTASGDVHVFNTGTGQRHPLFHGHVGKFVGVDYSSGGKFCLTCREDGQVQAWAADSGMLTDALSLHTKACSLACCPSSMIVAVGTCDGHVIYVDISSLHSEGGELRQAGRTRMHHSPVTLLQYDSRGNFLLTASNNEKQIFVINARPSAGLECIGYVDCQGTINHLSIYQSGDGKVTVAATITRPQESDGDRSTSTLANVIQIFNLTDELLKEPAQHFQSLRHDFKESSVNLAIYELGTTIDCAVIISARDHVDLAVLSRRNKKLMRFNLPLPEVWAKSTGQNLIEPFAEHEGHQLGGGYLTVSPHGQWLASTSRDGEVFIRDLENLDSKVSILAHSPMDGGARCVLFSSDANQIITAGADDDSITCFSWNLTAKGRQAINSAVEYARLLNMQLRGDVEAESESLTAMENCRGGKSSGNSDRSMKEAENESARPGDTQSGVEQAGLRPDSVATTESHSRTPDSDATWLDIKQELALKEESAKYDEVKKVLKKQIKEMRTTIMEMMKINETLPEIEQLRHDEYNLDTEEQKRMQSEQDKQVQKVREDINFENLAQRYLAYLVKKECWDDMDTKGRAIRAFNSNVIVSNYPVMEVTAAESELLQKVTRMRKVEIAANAARKTVVEAVASTTAVGEEDEEEEDAAASGTQLSLHGSLGPNYSGESDLFYSQFELHTREEKLSQIVLVKDAIRRVKDAFNGSFSNVYHSKEQEIARVKERNVRIRQILAELEMDPSSVMDPALGEDEMPEKVFEVSDDEVMVERVYSEEEKKEIEEQQRVEEEKKAAAKGDNKRERALQDMMGGVLEVKKEDILKQDIPPPDCVTEKLEKDWTDEEKKKAKDYEKKKKELQEEREKYRKNLENELKKLQQTNVDGMVSFDESLTQLYNRKVKIEMVVNQEELKILRLTHSIMTDDELRTHEANLNYAFDLKTNAKAQSAEREAEVRHMVEEYREVYDSVVAEDKMLDRGFKRDFSDVPLSLTDQLYKLFKRRPRPQRFRNVERASSLNPYADVGTAQSSGRPEDEARVTLDALVELDNEANMPEGCDSGLWTRLCHARRNKVESEIRVKQSALTLAEMTQYLQLRQEEDESIFRDIEDIARHQTKLYEDIMRNTLNLEVQFLLKQGRVEITCGPFIPDYSDSILIHRGVVEDLNGTIRTLGESKVAAMTESKDFKKGIHQLEWDRKRMLMQMEDLRNKARHIQMLKLTKELQAFLNEENNAAKQAKQVAVLEQTLALQDKQLDRNVEQKNALQQQLMRTVRTREHENRELDKILEELHVSVSERKNIADVNATVRAKDTPDKRLKGIVQRRRLVDIAKAQAQEVAVLRAEVERLRMKTFPALVQVEH